MNFFKRRQKRERTGGVYLCDAQAYDLLVCEGYTSLANNPEIAAATERIASLVGSMTIHLMRNGENGDVRVKNGLSRLVDIAPNPYMTRFGFISWIVRNLIIEGNVTVYPRTKDGWIDELIPIPPSMVSYVPDDAFGYRVIINGQTFAPSEVLHFAMNPSSLFPWRGEGCRASLSEVAHNLRQAAKTEKGFMESKWKPPLIVKVDGLVDEFSSPEGRDKLLDSYISSNEAGKPWLIPAEQFSVESVKPLTLNDLAIADVVTLDKRTIASVIGVPAFALGVGEFRRDEWNNFIATKIMTIAKIIEQTLTKGLLYSDKMYFRCNPRNLYSYDLKELAAVADDQFVRGIMTGNEVRDWLNLTPLEGLDELVILENYIPRGMIADQSKLQQGGEKE